jgi:hypothetical protein
MRGEGGLAGISGIAVGSGGVCVCVCVCGGGSRGRMGGEVGGRWKQCDFGASTIELKTLQVRPLSIQTQNSATPSRPLHPPPRPLSAHFPPNPSTPDSPHFQIADDILSPFM